jgi:hypothetical protein
VEVLGRDPADLRVAPDGGGAAGLVEEAVRTATMRARICNWEYWFLFARSTSRNRRATSESLPADSAPEVAGKETATARCGVNRCEVMSVCLEVNSPAAGVCE